jgi:hypothetical protein
MTLGCNAPAATTQMPNPFLMAAMTITRSVDAGTLELTGW